MQRQRCLPGEDTPVDVHTLGRGETEADGIRSSTERVGNVIGNPRNAVNVDGDMQALQRRKKEKGHNAKSNGHGEALPRCGLTGGVIASKNGVNRKVALT